MWGLTRNRSHDPYVHNRTVTDKRRDPQRKWVAVNPVLHLLRVDRLGPDADSVDAAELGRLYNHLGLRSHLSLAERVRVFLMFNGSLYQSMIDHYRSTGQRGAGQWATLHARVQDFSNTVLLALVSDAEAN